MSSDPDSFPVVHLSQHLESRVEDQRIGSGVDATFLITSDVMALYS